MAFRRTCIAAFAAAALALIAAAAVAQAPAPATQLRIQVSQGQLIQLPRPAASVFVADPAIADIQSPNPTSLFLFGKSPGRTSLFALDGHGEQILAREVTVTADLGDLEQLIHDQVPGATVVASSTPAGIVLRGTAPDPDASAAVQSLAARFAGEKGTVFNRLTVPASTQVNLRVRVAEVSRSITKQFGFNWNAVASPGAFNFGLATGRDFLSNTAGTLTRAQALTSSTAIPGAIAAGVTTSRATVNGLLDLLAEEGLVSILAEPSLTAVSGQPASFLAGGEFPIPVSQINNVTTIDFKKFGVSLEFVPTVLGPDRISMKVRPEVSELTTQGAVQISGITIPALTVRRAETTIELGSGQSFAIAGLIQNNTSTDVTQYPGLGNLPVLGALFRSSSFQRNETELVIIVTPYIVRPVDSAQALKLPTDGFAPASDLERIFQGMAAKTGAQNPAGIGLGPDGGRFVGDAGFTLN